MAEHVTVQPECGAVRGHRLDGYLSFQGSPAPQLGRSTPGTARPVMVWRHGGGDTNGEVPG